MTQSADGGSEPVRAELQRCQADLAAERAEVSLG